MRNVLNLANIQTINVLVLKDTLKLQIMIVRSVLNFVRCVILPIDALNV